MPRMGRGLDERLLGGLRRGTCVRCDRLLFRFLKHAQCVSTRSLRIGWPREAWHRVQRDQAAKKRQMGLCAGENSSFELRGSVGVRCWASADFTTLNSPKGRPKLSSQGPGATKTRPKRLANSTGHLLGGEMASSTWNQCRPVNRVVRTVESKGTKVQRVKHIPRVVKTELPCCFNLTMTGVCDGGASQPAPGSTPANLTLPVTCWDRASLGRFCHDSSNIPGGGAPAEAPNGANPELKDKQTRGSMDHRAACHFVGLAV